MAFRAVLCAAVLLVSTVYYVEGKADGAPVSSEICSTLKPKHGPTEPQNGVPPYDFSLSSSSVKAGDRVTVTIKRSGNGPSIKGFMLQARKSGGTAPLGKWAPVSGLSKGMKCSGQADSSLTHVNNDEKNTIEAEWVAPAPGTFEILQTVVQDGGTYWVAHKTQSITVS